MNCSPSEPPLHITVGVLALQGAFSEHLQHLRKASTTLPKPTASTTTFTFLPVRSPQHLSQCQALIIPGGESTTISLIASRSNLLQPLREFVKLHKNPTWGTCAGMILLSEKANRTKTGGQELIGGLDVLINRNHFGRQVESFTTSVHLGFLDQKDAEGGEEGEEDNNDNQKPFECIFIRAPVVEHILSPEEEEAAHSADVETIHKGTVSAPTLGNGGGSEFPTIMASKAKEPVEILASLPVTLTGERTTPVNKLTANPAKALGLDKKCEQEDKKALRGNIVAVRQGNVFGTSFHPELTGDVRLHRWWLKEVVKAVRVQKAKEISMHVTT